MSRTGRFLAWHEYTLRVTDLQTDTTRLVPEYSDGEFRPSWSADERSRLLLLPGRLPDGATSLYDRIERSVTHVVADCFPAERALTRDASAAFVSCRTSEDQQDAVLVVRGSSPPRRHTVMTSVAQRATSTPSTRVRREP